MKRLSSLLLVCVLVFLSIVGSVLVERAEGQSASNPPVLAANNLTLPTAPFVLSANFCYDGTLLDLCQPADGGTGVSTANTTRTVIASALMRHYISVGTTEDEVEVKATPGTLVSISSRNNHASANAFVRCSNLTAANTTPGTSTVIYELMVKFGESISDSNINSDFSIALTCWIVLGEAVSDVAEVAANDVSYSLRYR